MGNRAVVTFDRKPSSRSIGVYLHWNGGPESILAFAEACDALGAWSEDGDYLVARFVQIVGNFIGGTTSLGVGSLGELDCDNGDNGLFIATKENGKIALSQSIDGSTTGPRKILDLAKVRKHPYWANGENGVSILDRIIAMNRPTFER